MVTVKQNRADSGNTFFAVLKENLEFMHPENKYEISGNDLTNLSQELSLKNA